MNRRSGFTLVELLTVMGIMVLLMGISTIGFMGMRRGAEMRGAAMSIRTTLMLARQQAVTKRQNVTVQFFGTVDSVQNWMLVTTGPLGITNSTVNLPLGVGFDGAVTPVVFTASGSAQGSGQQQIKIMEKKSVGKNRQSKSFTVWTLTGVTKEN